MIIFGRIRHIKEAAMSYKIGIDIGSTTVKVVVLGDGGRLLFRSYERHYSKVREKAAENLRRAAGLLNACEAKVLITGSAGLGVSKASGIPFVQEVFATGEAVGRYFPDADAVIELGGEDAKIIFFKGGLEERMNGTCAGGTGAFIDQMATLLNLTVEELDALSLNYTRIYPIASRCGVFAKSDIQPILNQGGRKEDIAASIFQAVVDQTVSGLTQGKELKGKIVFLGGPLYFLKGLRNRFKETLNLTEENAVFPENADCFAAIGAALCAEEYPAMGYQQIIECLECSVSEKVLTDTMPPLFSSEQEYEEFKRRHRQAAPETLDIEAYSGDAYLGIDAGSTTTKMVLITPDGKLLYTYYGSNQGNPVTIVLEELKKIREKCGERITIAGSAVTGYGEELIRSAFSIDLGLVETIAHLKAAQYFDPNVDFIIDIGGQDMKCFKIRNGAVDSIMLNEACSSGCGSFIESFAKALGYEISEFAQLGIMDRHPVNLGSRCTVFMNSSVKQAQKEGASVEDISAGLSISIVKNAIYKVIRASSPDDLGRNIVVQGGTFLNDAVLRCFEKEIGRNVTRPAIAGLMGAYGAALYASEAGIRASATLDSEALATFSHTAKPAVCSGCTNRCSLTVNVFDGGRRFISGNRCSKPLGYEKAAMPDMFRYKMDRLKEMCGKGAGDGSAGTIGIPFGLNMFENLPFWFTFFTSLNFEVVLSPVSNREQYKKGQHTIPSDTVCYPAKLMHGHVEALLDLGTDAIFYPCMPYNFDEGKGDNHYNCPVVAYYPELLQANVARLKETKYLAPYVGLHRPKDFKKHISAFMLENYGLPAGQTEIAADKAYEAYRLYKEDIIKKGEDCIAFAREHSKTIIVVAGRPYHIDPEINHGINELIGALGLVLITEDCVAHHMKKQKRKVLNQWTYQARMYDAARYVCTQPDMQMIQLISFGCGTDAITTDELRDILEQGGKLYTPIKIDDINNLGAIKIRLRSLIAAIEARKPKKSEKIGA
jgi:predicted CoA-substrate-specific enzyme activase